jgi:hypothetical protein
MPNMLMKHSSLDLEGHNNILGTQTKASEILQGGKMSMCLVNSYFFKSVLLKAIEGHYIEH